jgi:hypothetical protein
MVCGSGRKVSLYVLSAYISHEVRKFAHLLFVDKVKNTPLGYISFTTLEDTLAELAIVNENHFVVHGCTRCQEMK